MSVLSAVYPLLFLRLSYTDCLKQLRAPAKPSTHRHDRERSNELIDLNVGAGKTVRD